MAGVYEIHVQDHFSAAHSLTGYDGDCSKVHGHNWEVKVFIQCRKLNSLGIGIDFRDVRRMVKSVLSRLDHTHLNELADFTDMNPTAENISELLYKELEARLNTDFIKVTRVQVFESPGCGAAYWEE